MAEELDPKISRRYRELGEEEPPRELDQAILAAARRAAGRAHASLVKPGGRHRWYLALGTAAILVLAVALTVQLDRGQRDPEAVGPASAPSERKEAFSDDKTEASSAARQAQEQAPTQLQKPSVRPDRPASPARDAAPLQEKPQAPPAAAPVAPAPSQADGRDLSPDAAAGMLSRQQSRTVASVASPLNPEQLLERIAELRKEGRHDEADKALAEFRQRYPDYRIPDAALKKVERPK